MQLTQTVRTALAILVVAFALTACSGDDDSNATPAEVIDLRDDADTNIVAGDETTDDAAPTVDVGDIELIDEPAVRLTENADLIEATNWVARTYMDSSSVELVWAPVEGADDYILYRLPTADADYDAIAAGTIDGADEVYKGLEFGYIDNDVPADEFLTYVLVAEVDGGTTEPRWTEALTVDDTTPPAPITNLTASETDGGVLLEWDPSPDDVEFAAYNVSILEEGQFRYIGGGADVGQVSFLDDEDFAGIRTYVVVAVDFHDNVSEAGQIEISR